MLSLSLLSAAACGAAPEEAAPEAETSDAVLGHTTYESCSPEVKSMLEESTRFARIAANSPAFAQCIRRTFGRDTAGGGYMPSPYRKCTGDPFYASSVDVQIQKVLEFARNHDDVKQICGTSDGNAHAGLGSYGHMDEETLTWNGPWLTAIQTSLGQPVCTGDNVPAGCRWAAYPWPYQALGGILYHEASHTHGYTHGANDQPNAIVACGYSGDATWNFQWNTMPYLIGNCISAVIDESYRTCGAIETSACGGDALNMVNTLGGTSCGCVNDPGWRVIGGAASEVAVGGFGTFATYPGNGNVLQFDGAGWRTIGGPGAQFAANDVALYALTPDRSATMQFDGARWFQIGGAAQRLIAGGRSLYAIQSGTGNVMKYDGVAFRWTVVGGPGAQFVVSRDDVLYAATPNRAAIMRYSGTPGAWTQIGYGSSNLIVGGGALYAIDPANGNLLRYNGSPLSWRVAGGPGRQFVANDVAIYGQSPDASAVYRLAHNGTSWSAVGGRPILRMFAGGRTLIAEHETRDLMRLANP